MGKLSSSELGMAAPARTMLHAREDHVLFEVVDPASDEPLPEGEAGELVITTLTKEALPMLRYRTRDSTRLASGRTHQRITGRNDDMPVIRGVNGYPSQPESPIRTTGERPRFEGKAVRVRDLRSKVQA